MCCLTMPLGVKAKPKIPKCPECGEQAKVMLESGDSVTTWVLNKKTGLYDKGKTSYGTTVRLCGKCWEEISNTKADFYFLDRIAST